MRTSLFISILINNYNYSEFLSDSINSAIKQDYPNKEIIVVDDGSTDSSVDIIKSYQDQVQPILKENEGQASAFNAGFQASHGDIICFLDADDYFFKHKLEVIITLFNQYPEAGWIFHELEYVDTQKQVLDIDNQSKLKTEQMVDFRLSIRKGQRLNYRSPCGICYRRSVLEKILPMPTAKGVSLSDNYLRTASLAVSPGLHCPQKLAAQRIHNRNIYTFKPNVSLLRAEISVKTAYYLRVNFPEIGKFTNKSFIRSFVFYVNQTNLKTALDFPEAKLYFKNYLNNFRWLLYLPRLSYFLLKTRLEKLRN